MQRKKLLFLGALLLSWLSVFSQDQIFYPVKVGGKWGLMNESGEQVVPAIYDGIGKFRKGHAVVNMGQQFGVIGLNGQDIVPVKFNFINRHPSNPDILLMNQGGEYLNGTCRGGIWGYLNTETGNYVPPQYEQIGEIVWDYFPVAIDGKWGARHLSTGFELSPTLPPFRMERGAGLIQLIGAAGKGGLTALPMQESWLAPEYDTVASLGVRSIAFAKDGKWGVARGQNQIILPPTYSAISTLSTSPIRFKVRKQDTLCGMLDENCKPLIPCSYDNLTFDQFGWVSARLDTLFGAFSSLGEPILPVEFQSIEALDQDYLVTQKNGKLGLYDRKGKEILPHKFSRIWRSESVFICHYSFKPDLLQLFREDGKLLIPDTLNFASDFYYNVAQVRRNDLQGLLHLDGTWLQELEYEKIIRVETAFRLYKNDSLTRFYITREGKPTQVRQFMLASRSLNNSASNRTFDTGTGSFNTTGTGQGEGDPNREVGWFHDPNSKKWGLIRRNENFSNGEILIHPKYFDVSTQPDRQFTLVSQGTAKKRVYGIVDVKKGKEIMQPAFDEIRIDDFQSQNVCRAVNPGGKHVLIRKNGRIIASKDLKWVDEFQHGYCRMVHGGRRNWSAYPTYQSLDLRVVKDEQYGQTTTWMHISNGKWGLVDKNGKYVLEPVYDFLGEFKGGLMPFQKDGKWGVMDTLLAEVLPAEHDFVEILKVDSIFFIRTDQKSATFGYLNGSGEMIIPARFEMAAKFSEGLAAVKQQEKWGYIDKKGNWVIPPRFKSAQPFHEGLARVKDEKKEWTFIDKKGNLVFEKGFFRVRNFSEGRAAAMENGRWGFIGPDGEWLVHPKFTKVSDFEGGLSIVRFRGRQGVINPEGDWVIPAKYYSLTPFENGATIARQKKGFLMLNREGDKISRSTYRKMGNFQQGLAWFMEKGKYGYMNTEGREVIPAGFQMATDFSFGLAAIRQNGKWGYIDTTGKIIVEPIYYRARPYKEGFAAVLKYKDDWQFLNLNGNPIGCEGAVQAGDFSEGRARIQNRKRLWGYIDQQGSLLIECKYREADDFSDGKARVMEEEEYGFINLYGGPVTVAKFDKVGEFSEGLSAVRVEARNGLFRKDGSRVLSNDFESIEVFGNLLQVENSGNVGYLDASGSWVWPMGTP